MAFNYQRGTRKIELIRFCSDGKQYPGAFSRMFNHAIISQEYKEVISFVDLRYSIGEVYDRNGFTMIKEIGPDYRYVVKNKTMHKSSFTKAKISKKFDIDMTNLTERQAMAQLGIHRIYDCGKIKIRLESLTIPTLYPNKAHAQ